MNWLPLLFILLTQCTTPKKTTPLPPPTPQATIEPAKIKATIHAHRRYLSDCYGQALIKHPQKNATGTVFVEFKIGPDGKAFQPQVIASQSTLHLENLNQCLFAGIQSWDFPVHPNGEELTIKYPFQFNARPAAGMQKKLDQFERLRNH